uniref:Uncharacterized protein n=1 Tax=Chelonoidis abingdonii TaxID=106734 RepID=A0A8C0GKQ6_CHEAB
MTSTGHTSPAWPGAGRTPGPYSQPDNSNLVDLFNKFFSQSKNPQDPHFLGADSPPAGALPTLPWPVPCRSPISTRLTPVTSFQGSREGTEKISVVPNQFMDPSHFPIIMGIDGGTRCLSCGTSAQPTLITHRFESVAFPGWYLSTSPRNDQPLQVTNRLGEAEITNFYFKKV